MLMQPSQETAYLHGEDLYLRS